ncbi:hypothetical protein GGI12_001332 [Dipsacomyces acuminosporus]|nr:hypothetical protein GGI12_001332 [Dipsacomyces acuminosporus]
MLDRLTEFSDVLFSDSHPAVDIRQLTSLCFRGIPDVNGLRSLCWQLLLGYLPPDRHKWAAVLKDNRQSYFDLVSDIASAQARLCSDLENTPGADSRLFEQIRADISRTMPDIALFHSTIYQKSTDSSRCGTNVSESTLVSSESEDTQANMPLADSVKRASLSNPQARTDTTAGAAQSKHASYSSQVNCLRKSLSEKISAVLGKSRQTQDAHSGDKPCPQSHPAARNSYALASASAIAPTKAADSATDSPTPTSFAGTEDPEQKQHSWLLDQPQTHADALARILFVHAQFNRGVGYAQGMNEILAPIYYVLASSMSAIPRLSHGDCEADAFHLFILALRGVHLDMFISAMDSSTFQEPQRHEPKADEAAGTEHQTLLPSLMADKIVGIPLRMIDSKQQGTSSSCMSAPAHPTSRSPDVSAFTSGEIGGLQRTLKYWWTKYVRLSDAQLWMHLNSLGIQPEHFALRWLLVWGAREFSLPDVLLLWDALMANRARLSTSCLPSGSSGRPSNKQPKESITGGLQPACRGDHEIIKPGQYRSINVDVGKLACDLRVMQGISGDDDDESQLGFLFDFFTAVLLAMKPQIMELPFDKCIALLQCLPRHADELDMYSLIGSTLRIRQRRTCNRAVKACRNVLAAADPRKRDVSAAKIAPLFAIPQPSPVSPVSSIYSSNSIEESQPGQLQQTPMDSTPAAKVSRFFGQLSEKLRLNTPPASPANRAIESPFSSFSTPLTPAASNSMHIGSVTPLLSPVHSSSSSPKCLLLAIPQPRESGMQRLKGRSRGSRRLGIFEVVDYSDHKGVATVSQLGECDALSPSLVDTRTIDSTLRSDIKVKLEPATSNTHAYSPSPVMAPSRTTGAKGNERPVPERLNLLPTSHSHRPATRYPPHHRNTAALPNFGEPTTDPGHTRSPAADDREQYWWKRIPASAQARLVPLDVELCDYDSDNE